MRISPDSLYIGKLRAISREPDALALRQRLGRALSAADLLPRGLPASAIVCIRRFQDPLPGAWRPERGSLRPSIAWERAVAASLDQIIQRAARPAVGVPPAGAEAVLFIDRSELLACLASDWQEGSALTRWWWQSLFEGADVALAVLHEWLAAPEYIPAAVARLAVKRKAAAFANALRPADARALLQAVTHRFALNELAS